MHHHLPTARTDGVDDAGALFGASRLRNEGIVSIHAYSYSWEEGRRKRRERGEGDEEGKSGGRTHLELLVEEDPRLLVRDLDDAPRRTAGWRREGDRNGGAGVGTSRIAGRCG
jgi:hypothetical protein